MLPAMSPTSRFWLRTSAAVVFATAGAYHFFNGASYERMIPPGFPNPRVLVAVSGVCEMLGGLGLLVPRLRRPAAVGLVALLVAVFPANLYMAARPERFGLPAWALWARLPLQVPLVMWAWAARR